MLRTEEPTSGVDAWWQMARRRLLTREFFSFAFIGCVCTLLYIGVYSFSRIWLHPLGANSAALVLTAPPNFLANRVLTFRAGDGSLPKQAGQYAVFYALGIGGSSLALGAFLLVWAEPPRLVEFMAALLSTGVATVIRYLALSYWVFPARNDSVRILRARSRSAQTT